MKQQKKITFIHLLNDFSGSPLVLSNVVRGLKGYGYDCEIITSGNSEGFLSNIEEVDYRFFNYRFNANKFIRLLLFFKTQLILFFKVFKNRKEKSIIYINTLLPFGAALAGWISGQKVVYHIHETSLKPLILKRFLKWMARLTSSYAIYVSDHLRSIENLQKIKGMTIHNALSDLFIETSKRYKSEKHRSLALSTSVSLEEENTLEEEIPFTVLMLCSLKAYKGVNEFVQLSRMLPQIRFNMVVNATQNELENYFLNNNLPTNLQLFSSQKNVHPFYKEAHLVLNLSHPEQWVETFGMTILEGMHYGLPCIAPPVGGPTEIIENNVNGFLMDQRNLEAIGERIVDLSEDQHMYFSFSKQAFLRSKNFNYKVTIEKISKILHFELS